MAESRRELDTAAPQMYTCDRQTDREKTTVYGCAQDLDSNSTN